MALPTPRVTTIQVPTYVHGTYETVKAIQIGPWAFHKSTVGAGYAITFAPTGWALPLGNRNRLPDPQSAQAFLVGLLTEIPALLRAEDNKAIDQHRTAIKAYLRSYAFDREFDPRDIVTQWAEANGFVVDGLRIYPPGPPPPKTRMLLFSGSDLLVYKYEPLLDKMYLHDVRALERLTPAVLAQLGRWLVA